MYRTDQRLLEVAVLPKAWSKAETDAGRPYRLCSIRRIGPETFLSKIFEVKMLANLNFEGCIKQNCSFWKVAVLPRWFKTVETSAKYGLRCFPDPSCRAKSLPRKIYGARNLGGLLFEGCTVQNHCFWSSQVLQNRFKTVETSAKYGLQCFPDPSCRSESLPRKTYGARNLGDSLFEGCTVQNHCFWKSQGLQNRFETMLTWIKCR